jgi:hypothetical protein
MIRLLIRRGLRVVLGERGYFILRGGYTTFRDYAILHSRKDAGYSRRYYGGIENANAWWYRTLAGTVIAEFSPQRVIDVGCGAGGISLAFLQAGCPDVHCFDYSSQAVENLPATSGSGCALSGTTLTSCPARTFCGCTSNRPRTWHAGLVALC